MRKLLLIVVAVLAGAPGLLHAQPWMKPFEGRDRVKLSEVIEYYKTLPKADPEKEAEEDADVPRGAVREGHDYQFDRWKWYWERHLDKDGYIVSPRKMYDEWEAYKARKGASGAQYRTTANGSSNWAFLGPTTSTANGKGVGRIQKVSFHPTDSNQFWICSAGGGAWKTINNGATWTCMTDGLPVLGVADVAYNRLNPQVLYLCTGDRDAGDNASLGVMKTTDGGLTWTNVTTSLGWTYGAFNKAYAIVFNPADTATLLLATSNGIYVTHSAGTSWNLTQAGNFNSIVYRPGDSNVVYATSNGGQIFRSGNGGASFSQVSNFSGSARVAIAVTPANPNIVKAIVANSSNYGLKGVYASYDTGKTFAQIYSGTPCTNNILAFNASPGIGNCDGQGWYDLTLAISPIDTAKMVAGGINAWYSTTGGRSWIITNQWSFQAASIKVVHADKHFHGWSPLRPTVLYEGNDGGVYRSADPATSSTWTDLTNGLGITQYYRIATADYANYALGGAQDNGSMRIAPGGARIDLLGGDGMNCELDPLTQGTYYVSLYYGRIVRNGSTAISDNIPGQPTGDWVTPYKIHPFISTRIVAGYNLMYLSEDQGDSWTTISPSWGSPYIQRVAFTLADTRTIYCVVGGLVRATFDKGLNWTAITGAPGGSSISDVVVDRYRKDRFWITFSGYGSSKVNMYDTTDGWQDITGTLPNLAVNCITYDTSNGTLYIGTDVAVWYRSPTMTDWALWNTNLPAVEIADLDLNYGTDEIWAGTYGRGIWKSPRLTFAPNSVAGGASKGSDGIRISPNPATGGTFEIRTAMADLVGQPVTVRISDIAGKTVWSGQQIFSAAGTLNVRTSLAHGTYLVDVAAGNGVAAKEKVVVVQ